jgi:hypothetical protein
MRVWGRIYDSQRQYTWNAVETDANGFNDEVYLTAFAQVLQLQLNESPFFSQYGIPAFPSVHNQTFPDANVYWLQRKYAENFISLVVTPASTTDIHGTVTPAYNVRAVTHKGSILTALIPT